MAVGLACLVAGEAAATAEEPLLRLTDYHSRYWNVEHGLPHASVRAVALTPDGYLWVATEGGLARFNGQRFTAFTPANTDALLRPLLNCLWVAPDGALWMGSEGGGLIRRQGDAFKVFSTNQGLLGPAARWLAPGPDGRVWVGTSGGQNALAGEVLSPLSASGIPADAPINTVIKDAQGNWWAGTKRGLFGSKAANGGGFSRIEVISDMPIYALCPAAAGGLWVGSAAGLYRLADGRSKPSVWNNGLRDNRVLALHEAADGTLWIGTALGLNRLRAEKILRETPITTLDYAPVYGFLADQAGNLWVAGGGGLHCLRAPMFRTISRRDGLVQEEASSITEGPPGRLLLGTLTGGVFEWTNNQARPLDLKLSSPNVTTLLYDRNGRLWVGSRLRGLDCIGPGILHNYGVEHGLPDQNISALAEDTKGVLWIGTAKGLAQKSDRRFNTVPLPGPASNAFVRCLFEAGDGRVWVGTSRGLCVLGGGNTNYYGAKDGLPSEVVFSVGQDRQKRIWAGTSKGLACLVDGAWRFHTKAGEAIRHQIFWFAEDSQGFIWYATPWSIFRTSIAEIERNWRNPALVVNTKMFTQADGLLAMECLGGRQPAGRKTEDGRLWFLTRRGVAVVDPARLPAAPVPPRVRIEALSANGHRVKGAGPIQLPAGTRLVEFEYEGIGFTAPEKIQFRHQLHGIDADWVEAGDARFATYANLSAGNYRFEVQASDSDGVWHAMGADLAFVILPRFYQRAWFYPLAIVTAGLLVLGGYGWRVRQLQRQKTVLEELVRERTRELEQQMVERLKLEEQLRQSQKLEAVGQLAAGLAHNLNNTLMVIQGNAAMLREEFAPRSESGQTVDTITAASERAARLIDQLLAFAQRHWMRSTAMDLNELVRRQAKAVEQQRRPGLVVTTDLDEHLPAIQADPSLIEQAIGLVVTNALEAQPQGGSLAFKTGRREIATPDAAPDPAVAPGHYAVLSVSDAGVGMTAEVASRAFDPFYTTKGVGKGEGLGLPVAYGIARQHKGWIQIQSAPGKGCSVVIWLPEGDARPTASPARKI